MPPAIQEIRDQLATVYAQMYVNGQPGYEQVTFGENAFQELAYLTELLPSDKSTELLFRLSEEVPATKVAELYNVLIWGADSRGLIEPEAIQEWFYGKQRRRIEIACQVDLFPSNSMEECERILEILQRRFPDLNHLLQPLLREVEARQKEEKAWSDYRRDTFEMPKEMTPSILHIIQDIKQKK